MLSKQSQFAYSKDEMNANGINIASEHGHADIVSLLLSAGCDPANESQRSGLPLSAAAYRGFQDVVAALLDGGVNVDDSSHSPPNATALHGAASGAHPDIVRLLIEKGADVNRIDSHGSTPLHNIAGTAAGTLERRIATIELLVANGAEINAVTQGGFTPLDLALRNNMDATIDPEKIVKVLEQYGGRRNKE